ncbi:unnamed protein product [Symbiodinium sp. CCMP2592]|nr:unnamed protein product [Symbiodinium sp. CCMP2592]
MPTSYWECNRCGLVVERPGWWIQTRGPCEHQAAHGCPGDMAEVSGWFANAWNGPGSWERRVGQACNCVSPALTLRVASLAGGILELGVRNDWTIAQVKTKMERLHGIAADQVCLSFGGVILQDFLCVEKLHFNDESPPVSWVRRHPDVVEWLKRVNANWQEIHHAPENVRKSAEVILAVLHQAHHAISLVDTELLRDVLFLQQACEMRGFDKANGLSQMKWLRDVADIHTLLSYAIARGDDDLFQAVIGCDVYRDLGAQDCVDVVLSVVSQGNTPESAKLELLKLLLDRIPAQCLRKGFNSKFVADKELAVALLESERAAQSNQGPYRQVKGRLLIMPPEMQRHDFALEVLLLHKDTFSNGSFGQLLRYVAEDEIPLDKSLSFVLACLSYDQPAFASRAFGRAADGDVELGVQIMLEAKLPLTSLKRVSSPNKTAHILEDVLTAWAPDAATLLSLIKQNDREILQLLEWTESGKISSIATCHCLHAVLELILEQEEVPEGTAQVGRLLTRAFVACSALDLTVAEKLPLAWLEDVRRVENSEKVVARVSWRNWSAFQKSICFSRCLCFGISPFGHKRMA